MKKLALTVLISVASSISFADNMAIFGDSYSDTGNLNSISTDLQYIMSVTDVYKQGILSDGDPALEIVAQNGNYETGTSLHFSGLAQGSNFAVGSARLTNLNPSYSLLSMTRQVSAFLISSYASDSKLAYVWIGINDVRDAAKTGVKKTIKSNIRLAVDVLKNELIRLDETSLTQVVVLPVPDTSLLPEIDILVDTYPTIVDDSQYASTLFNKLTKNMIKKLKKVVSYDLDFKPDFFDAFHGALNSFEDPKAYCKTLLITAPPLQPTDYCSDDVSALPQLPFADEIHPSAALHKKTGGWLSVETPVASDKL